MGEIHMGSFGGYLHHIYSTSYRINVNQLDDTYLMSPSNSLKTRLATLFATHLEVF